jgi:hypothetical protein
MRLLHSSFCADSFSTSQIQAIFNAGTAGKCKPTGFEFIGFWRYLVFLAHCVRLAAGG